MRAREGDKQVLYCTQTVPSFSLNDSYCTVLAFCFLKHLITAESPATWIPAHRPLNEAVAKKLSRRLMFSFQHFTLLRRVSWLGWHKRDRCSDAASQSPRGHGQMGPVVPHYTHTKHKPSQMSLNSMSCLWGTCSFDWLCVFRYHTWLLLHLSRARFKANYYLSV